MPSECPLYHRLGRLIGSRKVACFPYLSIGLKDKDQRVRKRAAMFLAELGPDAAPALPALESILQEKHDEVIAFAVEQIKHHLLKDDTTVRQAAAEALKKIKGDEGTER
jgi:HEAT repeat protein